MQLETGKDKNNYGLEARINLLTLFNKPKETTKPERTNNFNAEGNIVYEENLSELKDILEKVLNELPTTKKDSVSFLERIAGLFKEKDAVYGE